MPSDNNDNTEELTMDLVRGWVLETRGWFDTRELAKELNVRSRKAHMKVNTYLGRLLTEKPLILKRHPSKHGMYRLIDQEREEVDWRSADTSDIVPLEWAFGLHHLVKLFPKSICVVAGTSNAGKTALMLDFVARNQAKYAIDYYTSEMGPQEMKYRLERFSDMSIDDWNFSCFSRSDNFADVIAPDRISICDFLEVRNDFWTVGTEIHEIWDALTCGIAIVCVQKGETAGLGSGGQFSEHKSRLYLLLDKDFKTGVHTLKIRKGKIPMVEGVNPNGLIWEYTVDRGYQFHITKVPQRLPPDLQMRCSQ